MKTIKIGKDRELLFNLWAIKELRKRFGSLEKMSDAIAKDDIMESISASTKSVSSFSGMSVL